MCGIFGGVIGESSRIRPAPELKRVIEQLFVLSQSRGKEAAGLAVASGESLAVYKSAVPAREMMRDRRYQVYLREAIDETPTRNVSFIGHSRLVTNGAREINRNNQPVAARGIVGIHNGIIVNHAALWSRHSELERLFDVDSEVIFALLREQLGGGASSQDAARATFSELQGAASIAALFEDRDELLLATNNGSLYYRYAPESSAFVFSSERYIMDRFADKHAAVFGDIETVHVRPGEGALVSLEELAVERFALGWMGVGRPAAATTSPGSAQPRRRELLDRAPPDPPADNAPTRGSDTQALRQRFPYRSLRSALRRCSKCVLPETMPFIDFDELGVCGYCRRYRRMQTLGREALERLVAPHRRTDGRPDCIVSVSGGRDSMYGLHYIKTVLGMNPIAYTYDWGMVTDLARRNVSRICGKLGIEHILVSADIPRKRDNIRKNVEAWLERPSLGTVPLFMAGDKAYFYFLHKTREQVGVDLSFLCENPLERTDFKSGFAGIPPSKDAAAGWRLSILQKLGLLTYFGGEFIGNRHYLNSSLLDSAKAFAYYYVIKHDYQNLYRYVVWDEATIESTLLGEYEFELAEDAETTWRIGDGTAPFYNYIYYAIAGLTENDTFRSNQIREGVVTRERALELIDRDNRPRFPSLDWYLRTIGMRRSTEEVLAAIEAIPKLYPPAASMDASRLSPVKPDVPTHPAGRGPE